MLPVLRQLEKSRITAKKRFARMLTVHSPEQKVALRPTTDSPQATLKYTNFGGLA